MLKKYRTVKTDPENHMRAEGNNSCSKKLREFSMVSLSERSWRGSLITQNKYYCRGKKNTRSLISRRKTCQTK